MNRMEEIYDEVKSDKWFQGFAFFCRIGLAASFLPTGLVKIMGQRFAEGLPSNNPLGHYFDALYLNRVLLYIYRNCSNHNCYTNSDPKNFFSWCAYVFPHDSKYMCADLCYPLCRHPSQHYVVASMFVFNNLEF